MSCVRPPLAPEGFSGVLLPSDTPSAGSELSALDLTLRALRPLLANPEVTELCINRPREIFLETHTGWRREELPFADFDWCRRLASLVANVTRQRVDEASPLLSASLPCSHQRLLSGVSQSPFAARRTRCGRSMNSRAAVYSKTSRPVDDPTRRRRN
jgi:hypothetical protein